MKLYILTKKNQESVMSVLISKISFAFESIELYTDINLFNLLIKNIRPGEVDFIMIDISCYEVDLFNPYLQMQKNPVKVPICVFNDPYPSSNERADYWISKNTRYLGSCFSLDYLKSFYNIFKLIEDFLKSPEFEYCFSVIAKPLDYKSKTNDSTEIDIYEFKRENKIMPSRFKLFKYLYENQSRDLYDEDLCNFLWNKYDVTTRQYLYTYIHDLRRIFQNQNKIKINLLKDGKGIYRFFIVPRKIKKNISSYSVYKDGKMKSILQD